MTVATPSPFGLSLSKPVISSLSGRKEEEGFDKLSPNGLPGLMK
ncbi:MAG TPA: hypothetical protein VGO55_15325 [Allosphingosinicella sp.]|jgi:hypothetical protein|nr:hypothetical protein [Allosphingosinicella sp.]